MRLLRRDWLCFEAAARGGYSYGSAPHRSHWPASRVGGQDGLHHHDANGSRIHRGRLYFDVPVKRGVRRRASQWFCLRQTKPLDRDNSTEDLAGTCREDRPESMGPERYVASWKNWNCTSAPFWS